MKLNINESSTKFLNKETDIKHKDIVTIASEGEWKESSFKKEDGTPQNVFDINITLPNGEIRSTNIGFNNLKSLISEFGDETSEWVGKKLRAWKTKSEKAKLGYTYIWAPENWVRDETGEWSTSKVEDVSFDNL